jgi:hypothetical protein
MKIRDLIADTDDVLVGGKGFYSGDGEAHKQSGHTIWIALKPSAHRQLLLHNYIVVD